MKTQQQQMADYLAARVSECFGCFGTVPPHFWVVTEDERGRTTARAVVVETEEQWHEGPRQAAANGAVAVATACEICCGEGRAVSLAVYTATTTSAGAAEILCGGPGVYLLGPWIHVPSPVVSKCSWITNPFTEAAPGGLETTTDGSEKTGEE